MSLGDRVIGAASATELLRCPACRGALLKGSGSLHCDACGSTYALRGSIPVLRDPARAASRDHFDEVSHVYDHSLPAHVAEHYLAKRAAFLGRIVGSGRVLDVGCGTGRLLERLGPAYVRAGIDTSAAMLSRLPSGDVVLAEADADRLPFADASFDLAVCVAVMHHIADPDLVERSIGEMWRVVTTGGHVVVWDHNPLNPYWPLLMRRVPQDVGTERLVPLREIVRPLRELGARVWWKRSGFTPDFVPPRWLPLVARVERVLEDVPLVRSLGAHNVVVARKG